MTQTVDSRVLEMQFDNKQFESNVQTSMSTLDRLKQSLNMQGAAKGLESVNEAAKGINFESIASGVEFLQKRFSTLGIVGMQVVENITDSVMKAAGKLASFLTSGVIEGGYERALNLEKARFQLQGLLKDEEKVQVIMKNATDSVNDTAYSLDQAAIVASQFAASGIEGGDQMSNALKAVAGTAATASADYSRVGRIFTQVAGQGRLMGNDLLQLSSLGINAAAILATHFGKTEAEIRDMVSKSKISFEMFTEAMNATFGDHAKKANETFTGSMANVKAALARIGADFYGPLIEQNGVLVKFFNTLRERINDVKAEMGPFYTLFVGTASKIITKVTEFLEAFEVKEPMIVLMNVVRSFVNILEALGSILKPIGDAFLKIFPLPTINNLLKFSAQLVKITDQLTLSFASANKLKGTFQNIFLALKSVFSVLKQILKPIAEAFAEVFKPIPLDSILSFSKHLREITSQFQLSDEAAAKLKSTFKGLFTILSTVFDVIFTLGKAIVSVFMGVDLAGIFLEIGSALEGVAESVKSFVGGFLDKIADAGPSITKIFQGMSEAFSNAGEALSNFMDGNKVIEGGVLVLLVYWARRAMLIIRNFMREIKSFGGFDVLRHTLAQLTDTLYQMENQIRYDAILKIALALGVLAVSLLLLSTIDGEDLAKGVMAIVAMITALTMAMNKIAPMLGTFSKNGGGLKALLGGFADVIIINELANMLIKLSVSVLILSFAVKNLSDVDWDGLIKGLTGVGILLFELAAFTKVMDGTKLQNSVASIIPLAAGLLILTFAVKQLASLDWESLAKGLLALGVLLAELAGFSFLMGKASKLVSAGVAMVLLGTALKILASALKDFSGISWEEIVRGLTAMTGVLLAVSVAMRIMPKNILGNSLGLIAVAGALLILHKALVNFASMGFDNIALSFIALGGSLLILAAGLNMMTGTVSGSAALLIAVAALAILTPVLKALGDMSWGQIVKGLITMAGAFAILGVAGMLLGPLVPTLLALSVAIGLFSLAVLGFGLGLSLIGAGLVAIAGGFVALGGSVAAAAVSIVDALEIIIIGVLEMIPEIAERLVTGLLRVVELLAEATPQLAESLVKFILGVLDVIIEYGPQLADKLFTIFIGLLDLLSEKAPDITDALVTFLVSIINSISDRISELIDAGVKLVGAIFQGIGEALGPIVELILGPILQILSDTIVGIVEAIAPYIPDICNMFTELARIVTDAIVRIIEALAPFMPEVRDIAESVSEAVQSICDAFIALIEQIAPVINSITGLVKQLGDSISQIFQSVVDVIRQLGDSISQILQSIADVFISFGDAVSSVLESVAEVISSAGEAISQVFESIGSVVESVFTGISDIITSVGDSIRTVLDGIAGVIDSIGQAALNAGTGFENLANGVKTITELNLVDVAASMAAVAGGIADITRHSEGLATAGTGMQQIADGVNLSASAFKSMASGINTITVKLASIGPITTNAMSSFKYALTDGSIQMYSLSTAVSTSVKQIIESLSLVGSGTSSFKSSLSGMSAAVSSEMNSIVAVVSGSSGRVAAAAQVMMSAMVSSFSTGGAAIAQAISSAMNSAVASVTSKSSIFISAGQTMIIGLASGVTAGSTKSIAALLELLNNMQSLIVGRAGRFISAGVELMGSFASSLSLGGFKAITSISKVMANCLDAIKSYYNSFNYAGGYLGDGLIIGIQGKTKAAYNAGYALGAAAVQGEKDGQASASPSKETIKAGKWLGEGLVIGMKNMTKAVYSTGKEVGETAVNSISGTISKISNIIDSDMDVQPTISPVVDLSDVKYGAKAIESLLSNDSVMGLKANVSAINSTMSRRNQNGATEEIVSELSKLRKDVGNISQPSYTVGDITYDSGSEVAEAIGTLIRATRIERRV